jgi:hypothetical protein
MDLKIYFSNKAHSVLKSNNRLSKGNISITGKIINQRYQKFGSQHA